MQPVLVAIQGDEPKSNAEIRDIVATALNVSDEDRQVMLPSGKQALYTNRVAWAITHMTQTDLGLRLKSGSVRNTRVPSSVAAGVKWSQSGIIRSNIDSGRSSCQAPSLASPRSAPGPTPVSKTP